MSGYPYDYDDALIRSDLSGAHRPSANPRLHAVAKPYSRPSSYSGPSTQPMLNGNGNVRDPSPTKSLTKTTRSQLSTSNSFGSLPRSGSDSSLLSGLKSIFSRPLQWLATPSRGVGTPGATKRDSLASFGGDIEDPESPTDRHEGKRLRRASPRPAGDYEPRRIDVQGRAVSGFMLPPLPPHISLAPRSQLSRNDKPLPNRTNFSRPLTMPTSKSMPYLDPPTNLLASPSRRGLGSMSRSRRIDLVGFGDDDEEMVAHEDRGKDKGKEKDDQYVWSPWKQQQPVAQRGSMTPRKGTPGRGLDAQDYILRSLSPFKAPPSSFKVPPSPFKPPPSPSSQRQATPISALGRSSTTLNLRRAASVVSDISMGRDSPRRPRQSSSMLFSSINGERERDDERMSADGDRHRESREGSAYMSDWFMKNRRASKDPGSPASRAASTRLGSMGPSSRMPPIRKGQLVWDAEKGFVRESDLKAAEIPKPVHQNDAERILFALESMRKTPLTDARKSASSSSSALPPDLVGSSSRQLRKAISVPLATPQAGESAKQRRDRERLGDDKVSVMISPYGRRREVDRSTRVARRERNTEDRESDYRSTRSPSNHEGRQSSRSNHGSDHDMRSEREETPQPAPTPRRSSRLKRPDAAAEETTPKSKRTKSTASGSVKKAAMETTTPKDASRRTRKTTAEKATSPEPPPPVSSVPTITETAPSPGESSSRSDSYKPRSEGELPRGSSSLRARTEITKRAHTGAASYNSSRAGSPSNTGRYSAKEEDLPPMEDLEQAKIPLPSFSGISFGSLSNPTTSTAEAKTTSNGTTPSQPKQAVSLNIPSSSRLSGGSVNRMNGGVSTRPRASSPLAAGSIVAQPESPPSSDPPAKPAQPVADGFFRLTSASGTSAPPKISPSSLFAGLDQLAPYGPKKTLGSGIGKPTSSSVAENDNATSTSIPDFFGNKSGTPSGTSTPIAPPAPFNFGIAAKPAEPAATFSFGAKPAQSSIPHLETNGTSTASVGAEKPAATPSSAPLSFSASKPTEPTANTVTPSFSFATAKPADASKPSFSFATPSTTSIAGQWGEASKPAFSLAASNTSAPDATKPPAATPKPMFSFGASNSAGSIPKPAEDAPKPAFSFGTSSSDPVPTPAAAQTSSFGGFSFNKPADPAKDFAAGPTPSFSFGQNNGSAFGSGKQVNGTGEPAQTNPSGGIGSSAAAPSNSTFAFGASQPNGTAAQGAFGAPAAAPSTSFGFGSSAPAAPSNPFASSGSDQQAVAPSPTPSFSFGSNQAAAPVAASNPFAPSQPQQAVPSGGFGFNFNPNLIASTTPTPTTPSFAFGQSNPVQPTPPASQGFSFGTPASGNAQPSFSFGAQGATTTPQAPPPSFGFGAQNNAAPRFGSPVPAGASANGGGFSIGMSPVAPAPGSPSGRIIKPLKRAAKR